MSRAKHFIRKVTHFMEKEEHFTRKARSISKKNVSRLKDTSRKEYLEGQKGTTR